ncbi:magnesium chelatase subunit D [Jiella marina]|uniref:magnesium chelatase subunit D n=1 Tax=Jiella sp. LLJ827 TaxID=2917712 RepID=UPI002100F3A2|nr:magnesium chelatase subunit D [Jiella sp. LLJ827]MCQ0989627.1 magnesium chelatase subunit D [Jiella sp. LLJ827]
MVAAPSSSTAAANDDTADDAPPDDWRDVETALALFATSPSIGLRLAARPGPARDAAIALLKGWLPAGDPFRRMPATISEAALIGGLDLAASLDAGQPVLERGLLASADGGVVLATMAERMPGETATLVAHALDTGAIRVERDGLSADLPSRVGVVALDESMEADEAPPEALSERLGLWLALDGADPRKTSDRSLTAEAIAAARRRLAAVETDDAAIEILCQAAAAFGIVSLRAPTLALRTARASAALAGRVQVAEQDVETAIRHVLAPRATRLPTPPEEPDHDPLPDEETDDRDADTPPEQDRSAELQPEAGLADPPEDMTVETTNMALPDDLLRRLAAMLRAPQKLAGSGRAGGHSKSVRRGRVVGTRPGDPRRDRLDLVATLRAAAPWQGLRQSETEAPSRGSLQVRSSDLRIRRYRGKSETATIFAVDASGSAALARLSEAKGAVERILAECYVRRDRVALVAFRGSRADVLLPETKSLTRAKRCLSALPAGGGTPLASGILAALALARASAREGRTPLITLLTDGRANIGKDGAAGRPAAMADAREAAIAVRKAGIAALVVDLAQRPSEAAREIAETMGATYLALPRADSAALSNAVASVSRTPAASTAHR